MAQPLRAFHISGDQFAELQALPDALPPTGYLWIVSSRSAFEAAIAEIDRALARTTIAPLTTNLSFLRKVLASDEFRAGNYDTKFAEVLAKRS